MTVRFQVTAAISGLEAAARAVAGTPHDERTFASTARRLARPDSAVVTLGCRLSCMAACHPDPGIRR